MSWLKLSALIVFSLVQRTYSIQGMGFVKSSNLATTNWNAAVQTTLTEVAKSKVDCASLCHHLEQTVSGQSCNSFNIDVNAGTCTLANAGFLEDQQPHLTYADFYVSITFKQSAAYDCYGSEGCCSPNNLCEINEGDCNHEDDCSGRGLVCGQDNCLSLGLSNRDGGLWDATDDCCERRCTPGHPCPQGDGDCEVDADCANPTWQKCQPDSCRDNSLFPLAQYPNNTATHYLADDDCCIRRCYPGSNLCGHNVEGCQYDSDCESGLSCLPSGFCHDIDECADPNFCGADASCTNSIGSFTCTCNTGFENYVANVGCTDIDECAIGTATNCKLGTDCTNTAGSYTCACKSGYDGDPYVNCYDIDECEVYGMYACDFGDKTGPADMACKNWPGTFQCVDSAILNGGTHGHFYLMTAVNKDHYLDSLMKCDNHGLPTMNPVRHIHSMEYVNDYLFICGGHDRSTGTDNRLCTKLNLNTKQYEPMATMHRNRRHYTFNYVEDRIFAIAGHNAHGTTPESGQHCERTIEEYDIETNTWLLLTAPSEIVPLVGGNHRHATVSVGHRLFMIGGHECVHGDKKWIFVFDTRTRTWTQKSNHLVSNPVYDLACSLVYFKDGRKVIMCGGGYTNGVGKTNYVQYLDLANEDGPWATSSGLSMTWSEGPAMAYLGKTILYWSGTTSSYAWSPNNINTMNWDDYTWSRRSQQRYGAADEHWNAFTTISSKYFDTSTCVSSRWHEPCFSTNVKYSGTAVSGSPTSAVSAAACANQCMNTVSPTKCQTWSWNQVTNQCFMTDNINDGTVGDGNFGGAGKRFSCFFNWLGETVTTPQP